MESWLVRLFGANRTGPIHTHSFDPGITRTPTDEELAEFDELMANIKARAGEHNPVDGYEVGDY